MAFAQLIALPGMTSPLSEIGKKFVAHDTTFVARVRKSGIDGWSSRTSKDDFMTLLQFAYAMLAISYVLAAVALAVGQ